MKWKWLATRALALLAATVGAAGSSGCEAPEERVDLSYDDRFGDSTKLDAYLPAGEDGDANPAVLFIHGGSWRFGDKSNFQSAARRLARSGFAVASINYRLLPEGQFPKNYFDAACSLAYLRANAEELRIDPDRIAVMGYSAGAHLAGLVGLAADHPELLPDCEVAAGQPVALPAAVIPASGPQDMVRFWQEADDRSDVEEIFGGSPEEKPRAWELGSPSYHVREGAPPFLILEDIVDFGGIEAMRESLADAGNEVRLLQVKGSLHILEQSAEPGAYEVGLANETPEAWIAITDFLFRTVAREEAQ